MAYTDPTTRASGYIVLASDWNVFVNNFKETFVGKATTQGQTPYATGANAIALLSIGVPGTFYRSDGSIPEWANPEDGAKLDGDHLDIDFTPTNYTPDTTPAEAADVDDLAAHLAGIDNLLPGTGAKGWCYINADGTLATPSFNISSVTDSGTGDRTINWDIDYSSAVYAVALSVDPPIANNNCNQNEVDTYAAGSVRLRHYSGTGFITATDMVAGVATWGNQ